MGLWFTKSACLACAKSCAHTWKSGYPDTPKHITHGWSYQKHKDISYRIYEINGQFLFPVWGANWQGRRTRRKKLREVCIEEKKNQSLRYQILCIYWLSQMAISPAAHNPAVWAREDQDMCEWGRENREDLLMLDCKTHWTMKICKGTNIMARQVGGESHRNHPATWQTERRFHDMPWEQNCSSTHTRSLAHSFSL